MSFFFRWPLAKAFKNAGGWDESKVVRGKTTPPSTEGSFAPKGGGGGTTAPSRPDTGSDDGLKMAYADAWMDGDGSQHPQWSGYKKRALNYVSPKSTTLGNWARQMKEYTPGGYNEFSAAKVEKVLAPWADKITVRGGRQYSPVLFIEGDAATLREIAGKKGLAKRLKADEFSLYDAGHTAWDYTKPVGDEYEVMAKFKGPVLRVWWD